MNDPHHRCWAEIDLAALERNLRRIRLTLPPRVRYIAVVKANAYGHGLTHTAARLMQCGADMFAVANVHEARAVRELGLGWPILILSAVLPDEESMLAHYNLIATVSSEAEVDRFNALGKACNKKISVHMKIDTGMGRLGVWHERAPELWAYIRKAQWLSPEGIYTHYSSADTDEAFTATQRSLFKNALARMEDLPANLMIHADNSAGFESFAAGGPFNAVRIGLLQFGMPPHSQSLLAKLQPTPVLSFHTRIGLIKDLPAGVAISYGRTFTLKKPTRIAVLTAGYGDGIPTAASNRAQVLIRGMSCPVLGRVTMDQTIVDISQVPNASVNDTATLIGQQGDQRITVEEFSAWSNAIAWESLCSITNRVPRVYKMG